MRPAWVRLAAIGAATLALLVAPTAASAQTRHASPNGPDTGTCIQQPCSLEHAVEEGEAGGDSVQVGRGSYTLDDTVAINAIDVFGDPDYPRPTINTPSSPAGTPGILVLDGATLRYVNVRTTGPVIQRDAVRLGTGSRLDRVYARSDSGGSHAIDIGAGGIGIGDATVTNSVAYHSSTACCNEAMDVHGSAFLAGVTAYSPAYFAIRVSDTSSPAPTVTARNVIADGNSGAQNIQVINNGPVAGEPSLQIGDSFVGGPAGCDSLLTCVSVNGGPDSMVQQTGGANHYATNPEFVDAANGDFHQTATSPTLNQGAAVGSDLADIDGDRRTIGGFIALRDVGADERPGALSATPPSAVDVTQTSARLTSTIDPNGGFTRYFFHYDDAPLSSLGCVFLFSDTCEPLGNSLTPVEVSRQLTGLTPGTTYYFRLQAFHSTTSYSSPVETFTTPAPSTGTPSPAVTKKCKKGFKPKKVKGKKKKRCVKKKRKRR